MVLRIIKILDVRSQYHNYVKVSLKMYSAVFMNKIICTRVFSIIREQAESIHQSTVIKIFKINEKYFYNSNKKQAYH